MRIFYEAIEETKSDLLLESHVFNGSDTIDIPRIEMNRTSWTLDVDILTKAK